MALRALIRPAAKAWPSASYALLLVVLSQGWLTGAQAQQEQKKNFDIPAQAAARGITEFAREANIPILAPAEVVRGKLTNAVHGSLTTHEALKELLADTGLIISSDDGSAIVLSVREPPAAVITAEPPNNAGPLEVITITGTSIHGEVPAGSSLIRIDRVDIDAIGAQTVQQVLAASPQMTGFNNAAQGGFGSGDNAGIQAPTIHSLGASASNGTLILINGHHVPLMGVQHNLVDPSAIPVSAIQRIEILPDGASAIYGSDAVAGVVNIFTRREFNGMETSFQYGIADHYSATNFSQLFGHSWSSGSILAVYDYSSRSTLMSSARSYVGANQSNAGPNALSRGGSNFANYNCAPASIAGSSSSSENVFLYPYTAGAYATVGNTALSPCSTGSYMSLFPSETRNSALVTLQQAVGDHISLNMDLVYSSRLGSSRQPRGSVTATVFGPNATPPIGTGQINPFYQAGTTGLASEFVQVNLDDLLGHGGTAKMGDTQAFAIFGIDADLGGGWAGSFGATLGKDFALNNTAGLVSSAEALLALNGTTNSGGTANITPATGALADGYNLDTVVGVTRIPLTTANALDIWRPKATNGTSSTVLRSLTDSAASDNGYQYIQDVELKFDGPLLSLPAGELKGAVGGEFTHYNFQQITTRTNSIGPASTSSRLFNGVMARTVYSAFTEIMIPVVDENAGIPFVRKFDFDISGRYDHYSDFGNTKNPKVGFNWTILAGLTGRGSYGTSYTAPALASRGQTDTGINNATSVGNSTGGNQVVPATNVNTPGTWCAGGCVLDDAHPGITILGGNANLKPMTGLTYSAGFDLDFGKFWGVLDGLTASATYWQAKYMNLITTPTTANKATIPGLENLLVYAPPGGWTPTSPEVRTAIAGKPLSTSLNPIIWYINDNRQYNAFNIQANGIDFAIDYRFKTNIGDFAAGITGSYKLRFDEQAGPGSSWASFLNGHQDNTLFNAMQFTARLHLNWESQSDAATLFVNFVNPHFLRTSTAPFTGYQKVDAYTTLDINFSHNLPNGWFGNMQIFANAQNILDAEPPFFNTSLGYDPNNSNPIGRFVTLGFREKL